MASAAIASTVQRQFTTFAAAALAVLLTLLQVQSSGSQLDPMQRPPMYLLHTVQIVAHAARYDMTWWVHGHAI
jgi:hypothetical protein